MFDNETWLKISYKNSDSLHFMYKTLDRYQINSEGANVVRSCRPENTFCSVCTTNVLSLANSIRS